jgi:hypothetical protein
VSPEVARLLQAARDVLALADDLPHDDSVESAALEAALARLGSAVNLVEAAELQDATHDH